MKYKKDKNTVLEFNQQVIAIFEKYRQLPGKNEAGGILLRKVFKNKIIIEAVTTPDNRDKAGPCFFDRNREKAQVIVNEKWQFSKGEKIYLGEWHTHSEPYPKPSPRDKDMIRNMLQESKMEIDFLFTVIVGTHEYWVGYQKGKKLAQLKKLSY